MTPQRSLHRHRKRGAALLVALGLVTGCGPTGEERESAPRSQGQGTEDQGEDGASSGERGTASQGSSDANAGRAGAGEPQGANGPQDSGSQLLDEIPKRVKLGKFRTIRIRSDVTFKGFEANPHVLDWTAAFPQRSRSVLSNRAGSDELYEIGHRVFRRGLRPTAENPGESKELVGSEADSLRLEFALRRALYLWPDGIPFETTADGERAAAVGAAGRLVVVEQGQRGEAVKIAAVDSSGNELMCLAGVRWTEQAGRRWPQEARFEANGEIIWTEVTQSIDPDWFYGDSWFVPPDRLTDVFGREAGDALRTDTLPACFLALRRLSPGATLADAERKALASWSKASDELRLSRAFSITVDGEGHPLDIQLEAPYESAQHKPRGLERFGAWAAAPRRIAWLDPGALGPNEGQGAPTLEGRILALSEYVSSEGTAEPSGPDGTRKEAGPVRAKIRYRVRPAGEGPQITARVLMVEVPVAAKPASAGGR